MPRELLGLRIHLDERVYRPAEDSLLLASHVQADDGHRALDVCTGTGLTALILARQGAWTVATDVNPIACSLARRNAHANDLGLASVCTDVAAGIQARFDRIACNPPYLPRGERPITGPAGRALESGEDGTQVASAFLEALPDLMAREARAWLVVSSRQPLDALQQRARDAGLTWHVDEQQPVGRFERLQVVQLRLATGSPSGGGDR